jgi:hypothetical protein
MLNSAKLILPAIAVLAASTSTAFASPVPVVGTSVPFAILGIAAAGVIGGIWLARKKR